MKKMWSREDLLEYANTRAISINWSEHASRLNYCKAWYAKDAYGSVLLKSYDTIVAIYNPAVGSLYVFGYYSATTTQHVWKFARKVGAARITWLYRRHDNVIETRLAEYANTHRLSAADARKIEDNDYRGYIASKWGF